MQGRPVQMPAQTAVPIWPAARRLPADETFATVAPPPAWRSAEAIGAYRRDTPDLP
jgi:hypothetical protein